MSPVEPYLRRLGLTAGQAWTLALGLVLGAVLLAVSVPPVWDRRSQPADVQQQPLAPLTDQPLTTPRSTP